ncbi:MAG TPA: hypothetical protein VHZ74_18595, partial [Bryobacteraceae bacterium]|nr:hypothetical protein [Bryobacteraceae bacterium]
MQCPYCQSDDVTRSRRKFWERFVLPLMRAHVMRCRDCHKRHWIGVEWGLVILGGLIMVVGAGVVAGVIVAHRNQAEATPAPRIQRPRRIRPIQPLPSGLPPLSSVPTPKQK